MVSRRLQPPAPPGCDAAGRRDDPPCDQLQRARTHHFSGPRALRALIRRGLAAADLVGPAGRRAGRHHAARRRPAVSRSRQHSLRRQAAFGIFNGNSGAVTGANGKAVQLRGLCRVDQSGCRRDVAIRLQVSTVTDQRAIAGGDAAAHSRGLTGHDECGS
ncbi:hypothetical protein ON010_g13106 [Phytophthora cinnamomi]|nr:hypothetical protein ON010_g13106 [Phytophthora cinnamomi]